jgi:hypothetical protein
MKKLLRRLGYFVAANLIALTAAQAAEIPQEIRGTWCRIKITTDHGAEQHIFRRGEKCGGEIAHTYTSNGRSQKSRGIPASTCLAESVKETVSVGWDIVFDCGDGMLIEQGIWPMPRGRLGLVNLQFLERRP